MSMKAHNSEWLMLLRRRRNSWQRFLSALRPADGERACVFNNLAAVCVRYKNEQLRAGNKNNNNFVNYTHLNLAVMSFGARRF
jgi:hypothetical protein